MLEARWTPYSVAVARRGRRRQRAATSASPPPPAPPIPDAAASPLALIVTALAGAIPLTVYAATLTQTVAGGDAGEMITVAYLLGVAHPPGYPLYTMLAKVASLIPFGTVAWRVNLFSALAASAASLLLCRAVIRWTGDVAAGALAAGVLAFGPLVWPYAITAEVFALNNLFVVGLVYFSVSAARENATTGTVSSRTLNLGALWLGLGFAHHHILVFVGIPYALFLLALTGRRVLSPRVPATFAALVLLGMTPYLYLVVASGHAAVTWGDASTLDGFLTHFLRREYGTFRLAESSVGTEGGLGTRLAMFWSSAGRSTWWAHVPLGLAALVSLRRAGPGRWVTTLWVVALAFYVVVFSMLANARLEDPLHIMVQERFWQQALVVLSALMGVGLAELGRWLSPVRVAWLRWAPAVALPVALIATEAPAIQAYQKHFVQDYGAAILKTLAPDAILFISSDEAVNSVRYLQYVEGLRTDVRVIPVGFFNTAWFRGYAGRHLPDVRLPAPRRGRAGDVPFSFREFLDVNAPRPVYIVNRVPWLRTLEESYALWPVGLVERVLPRTALPDLTTFVADAEASFARLDPAAARGLPPGSWEAGIVSAYWKQYERYGFAVARLAVGRAGDPTVSAIAARVFETMAQRHPSPSPAVFKNLGVAYQGLSATQPDAATSMVRAWRRYLAMAPADDPDVPKIRQLVEDTERSLATRTAR